MSGPAREPSRIGLNGDARAIPRAKALRQLDDLFAGGPAGDSTAALRAERDAR